MNEESGIYYITLIWAPRASRWDSQDIALPTDTEFNYHNPQRGYPMYIFPL